MCKRWQCVIAVLSAGAAVSAAQGADYQLDQWNGAPEVPILTTPNPSLPYWIFIVNQFTVQEGLEYISEIQTVRFARANSSAMFGIWSDPNNDANPADAQLIWSTQVDSVAPLQSLSLQSVPVPFIRAGDVGDGFFIGWVSLTPYFQGDPVCAWAAPAGLGHNRSWLGGGPTMVDPNNLAGQIAPAVPFNTLVIRANGVPSPGVVVVMGMWPVWAWGRRRRVG